MGFYPQSPQPIGRVLDAGLTLYRSSFRQVLALSIPLGVVSQLAALWQGLGSGSVPMALLGLPIALASGVFSLMLYIAIIAMLDRIARDQPAPPGECLRAGVSRFWATLGSFILYALVIGFGVMLLVIPGVILMVSMGLAWYFIVLDHRGPVEALGDSHRLVWGHWWRTAAILTVAVLLYYGPEAMILLIVGSLFSALGLLHLGGNAAQMLEQAQMPLAIASGIASALFVPLLLSISLILMRDLQMRRSGGDLVLRAEAA